MNLKILVRAVKAMLSIVVLSALPVMCHAEGYLRACNSNVGDSYRIKGSPIVFDGNDFAVVRNAVSMLGEDLGMVTGVSPRILTRSTLPDFDAIIVGTVGKSRLTMSLLPGILFPSTASQADGSGT